MADKKVLNNHNLLQKKEKKSIVILFTRLMIVYSENSIG
jgi:hypothetical protein